jgi:hypothetical protein
VARPSAASASLPVMPLSIRIDQEQVVVGAAGDDAIAAAMNCAAMARALASTCCW